MLTSNLGLSFFWHMHQPDYRGEDGVMKMPWVFLHAIKDYFDMPWLLSLYPDLKATFNITATLIEQLNLYNEPIKNDHFLKLWALDPHEIDETDRNWVIKTCKSTQYETMVKPCRYFDALYHQDHYSATELIDFEVVFILAWCGNYLRQENALIRALMAKGSGFTQADKHQLLAELSRFITTIIPFYTSLQERGIISISTTPYNHPILPLLIDMDNALRANSHTILPQRVLSLKEDAILHVERSIALYEKTFGRPPTGFWPAEGAVDELSVNIYREHGLKWIATDEAILFKSLQSDKRSALYSPYRFGGMTIGFRDHGLSDLIGFTYRFKPGQDAAEHFILALDAIRNEVLNPTVLIIVDGENAWEYFENNGYDFFRALYSRLQKTSWCKTATMDEVSSQPDVPILPQLMPGSWIHGNFDTWSGHCDKNRAWEMIYQTRRDVDHYRGVIAEEILEKIRYHFLASECSDWFWWYGDDHMNEFADEFDTLFRSHLISIYRLLDLNPPTDLFEPIQSLKRKASFLIKPQGLISPVIDGKNSSFFDWLGCGRIDEKKLYSSMDRDRGPIDIIEYGYDEDAVYIALEGDIGSIDITEDTLHVLIDDTNQEIVIRLDGKKQIDGIRCAVENRIELSIARKYFGTEKILHLRFEINRGESILQILPGFGVLTIDLEEACGLNWFV